MIYLVASESPDGLSQWHKYDYIIPLLTRRFSAETALEVSSLPPPVAGLRVNDVENLFSALTVIGLNDCVHVPEDCSLSYSYFYAQIPGF